MNYATHSKFMSVLLDCTNVVQHEAEHMCALEDCLWVHGREGVPQAVCWAQACVVLIDHGHKIPLVNTTAVFYTNNPFIALATAATSSLLLFYFNI